MDISSLNNYFELYGGMAIFIVVLLEYMNLPGFPAGIIMPLAGIYAAHGGISLLAAIAISVLRRITLWTATMALKMRS